MGTILFVILKLTKIVDTPHDWIILCFLLSLDSIAAKGIHYIIRREKSGTK